MYCRFLHLMLTDVSEVRAASNNALMRAAVLTTETSVDIKLRTWQYVPEDYELHNCTRLLKKLPK
jgi:hypothetical protein